MTKIRYMKLTEGPAEIATTTRKVWGILFETYGWESFPLIEARGAIMQALEIRRPLADSYMHNLISRGFAEELPEP